MSRHDPSTRSNEEPEQAQRSRGQPIELERGDRTRPELRWIVVENPDQSFLLNENDCILDSQFNPEFDVWEVLIRLEPNAGEE